MGASLKNKNGDMLSKKEHFLIYFQHFRHILRGTVSEKRAHFLPRLLPGCVVG